MSLKILIVEDEASVAQNLCDLLKEISGDFQILEILESVEETIDWIEGGNKVDLAFFDIRLADGDSFAIFENVDVTFPVIFTTAYDQYAIKAFKVNSIDYLMKPIVKLELKEALKKYEKYYKPNTQLNKENILGLLKNVLDTNKSIKNLLVQYKDKLLPISINIVAYFYLENDILFCKTYDDNKYVVDSSLDKLFHELDSNMFYRINRQIIASRKSVKSASIYFNRKLKIEFQPSLDIEALVSKEKVKSFKSWLIG